MMNDTRELIKEMEQGFKEAENLFKQCDELLKRAKEILDNIKLKSSKGVSPSFFFPKYSIRYKRR